MVDIPDRLQCLFTGSVEHNNESYLIEIPKEEIEHEAVSAGETYRVAVLPQPFENQLDRASGDSQPDTGTPDVPRTPPVEEGEVRTVTVEGLGDRGDGIAKVEHGFVVIVPETETGDEVTIEIEQVRPNVAFARVVEKHSESSSTSSPSESENGTLDGLSAQPPPLDNENGP